MHTHCPLVHAHIQISRLQSGEEVCKEVYELVKEELKNPVEEYVLFWPHKKVKNCINMRVLLDLSY